MALSRSNDLLRVDGDHDSLRHAVAIEDRSPIFARIVLNFRPYRFQSITLAALVALLIGSTLVAPEEATLGAGMRWVYLHVSFTWAGTLLINLIGLAGLYLIVRPTAMPHSLWVAPAQTAGLILFGIGFALSLAASYTSWGGILWMEPRVLSSIGILAGGMAAVALASIVVSPRTIGLLAILLSVGVSVVLASTGRVFHPEDPIDTSDSTSIRLTFYALTVIAFAIGLVLTMILHGGQKSRGSATSEG